MGKVVSKPTRRLLQNASMTVQRALLFLMAPAECTVLDMHFVDSILPYNYTIA